MAKQDFEGMVGYLFGLASIVFGLTLPNVGIIVGVLGLIVLKDQKTDLVKRARKFNWIGIIISLVFFIIATFALINNPELLQLLSR